MLVSNGTRVALKANPPSPVTEPPHPADTTINYDPLTAPEPGAPEQQLEANQNSKPEVLEQKPFSEFK